jgi:hypothetical protein
LCENECRGIGAWSKKKKEGLEKNKMKKKKKVGVNEKMAMKKWDGNGQFCCVFMLFLLKNAKRKCGHSRESIRWNGEWVGVNNRQKLHL